jgi:protein TonB
MYHLRKLLPVLACCFISLNVMAQDMSEAPAADKASSTTLKKNPKYVQTMPSFVGSLSRFLDKNLQYPQESIERHQEGRVLMQFTVLQSGLIADVQIKEPSGYYLLDNEAMRVTRLMESKACWKPATQNGTPVRSLHTMPIAFELR